MKVNLFVNHRCNLSCIYCYNGRHFDRRMPPEIARRAIDFGLDHATEGYLLLAFFGGEPLLETELIEEAARYAAERAHERGKKLFLSLSTNGTVLEDRQLELLKAGSFDVQVSVDGGPEAQDLTRRYANGRSSYAKVESSLHRLLAAGFPVRVISVIDPRTVHLLPESFEHLADLGVPHIYFAPNYTGAWDEAACERFEAALPALGDRYLARMRAGKDVRLDPLNGKVVTHVVPGSSEKVACPFGCGEIAVSPTGRIYPCDRMVREDDPDSKLCIGDLDHGFDEARRSRLLAEKAEVDPECGSCELKGRCTWWCGCANYETTGSPGKASPLLCWFERSFIAEADRVANLLFAEKNPTFLKRFYVRGAPAKAG